MLDNYVEIIGHLKEIKKSNNDIKLIFTLTKEVDLSDDSVDISKLKKFLGKRIGICNLEGKILIREINEGVKNE